MFPFRGTNQLYDEETTNNDVDDIIDDDEWNTSVENKDVTKSNTDSIELVQKETVSISNNALGALMNAYNSSDDSENEEINTNITSTSKQVTEKCEVSIENDSDDEAPTEEKINRFEVPFLREEERKLENKTESENKSKSNDSTGAEVKYGHKRKRINRRRAPGSYRGTKKGNNNKDLNDTQNTGSSGSIIFKKRRVTLLERLLANEIIHEHNVLLQCVRYITENEFFDKKDGEVM